MWCWRRLLRVHSKGDQPWVFLGRNDAKAETPVLWPPRAKSWLIGKDGDAGRDWRQEETGTTEDEMAGWHHWLNGHESEWTPGAGDGQGGLACCDSWSRKESDMTEQLNWTKVNSGKDGESEVPTVMEPNWGLLAHTEESKSTDISLWWRKVQYFFFFYFTILYWFCHTSTESTVFITGTKQGEWAAHAQKTWTAWWLSGKPF